MDAAALSAELSSLKVSGLKQRARQAGVGEKALGDADDEEDVKGTIIKLIVEAESRNSIAEHVVPASRRSVPASTVVDDIMAPEPEMAATDDAGVPASSVRQG
eukprot:COSAG01_NODE_32309_length_583_cov_1.014463_1_plen_103_part_00